MRKLLVTGVSLATVLFASSADAQLADKGSFFHGFWSNNCYVAQREVYPRVRYSPEHYYPDDPRRGGWVLHERNW